MRGIKPGKIASSADKKSRGRSPRENEGKVWDDYSVEAKSKGKKVYNKGADNRFVPEVKRNRNIHFKDDEQSETEDNFVEQEAIDTAAVEDKIGYSFNDKTLIQRALTHRSALRGKDKADYERLEFLGDAVFGLSVAHLLSDVHPDATEGKLSKMRAALVNTQALADLARKLEIGMHIRLGRGEMSSGGQDRPSILADVIEALFGAMYRDSSYETAMSRIGELLQEEIRTVTTHDPKTDLQEILHAEGSSAPEYLVELVEGPVHAPTFIIVVSVDNEIVGRGKGPTKKSAQQQAAAEVIKRLTPTHSTLDLEDDQEVFIKPLLLTKDSCFTQELDT